MKKLFSKLLIVLVILLLLFNVYLLKQVNQLKNLNYDKIYQSRSIEIFDDVTKVYEEVIDSVVTIVLKDSRDNIMAIGSGSIIYNSDGDLRIITNNHVIDNERATIHIIFANGQETQATIVGSDHVTDLALLKTQVDFEVDPIEIGDSDALLHGQTVIAIGSPLDASFSGTITKGVISGLNRFLEVDTSGDGLADYDMNVIQTDTTINPGNSGGPLINMAGQLVGINQSKISLSNFEGMGFAIPVNDAILIIEQLEKYGEIERPSLGIRYYSIANLSRQGRIMLDVHDLDYGLLITDVLPNSSAQKAGLKVDDVIISVNEQTVKAPIDLNTFLYRSTVGDTLELVVIRDGKEISVSVKLT